MVSRHLDCEVCGTKNEARLTFCRTCGHRLVPKKAREVPPTPAAADAKGDLAREELADRGGDRGSGPPPARHSRPAAPPLLFNKGTDRRQRELDQRLAERDADRPSYESDDPPDDPADDSGLSDAPGPLEDSAAADAAVPAGQILCSSCAAANPKGYRFCLSCGSLLARKKSKPVKEKAPAVRKREPSERPRKRQRPSKPASEEPLPLARAAESDPPPARHTDRPEKAASRQKSEEVTGKLVVIVEDGSEGRELELRGQQVDVGSDEGDIVLSEDRYLSPRHARFFRQADSWYLRDLDSVNGVYRRLRKPEPLTDRDLVLLGLEVLQFELVDHAERGLGHAIQQGTLVFGSPATTRRARLCQRTVEGVVRDVYHLVADETTIGREIGDIVFTSDPFMSRRHAVIRWQESTQEYVLADLNSSNGTYLAIRDDLELENGDFIRLGQHLFRVDLPGAGRSR